MERANDTPSPCMLLSLRFQALRILPEEPFFYARKYRRFPFQDPIVLISNYAQADQAIKQRILST
jgi:hypothetical protein